MAIFGSNIDSFTGFNMELLKIKRFDRNFDEYKIFNYFINFIEF